MTPYGLMLLGTRLPRCLARLFVVNPLPLHKLHLFILAENGPLCLPRFYSPAPLTHQAAPSQNRKRECGHRAHSLLLERTYFFVPKRNFWLEKAEHNSGFVSNLDCNPPLDSDLIFFHLLVLTLRPWSQGHDRSQFSIPFCIIEIFKFFLFC